MNFFPRFRQACRRDLEAALQEIEVPVGVAEHRRGKLQLGESVFIIAQLSGGGGIIATEIHSGPPTDSDEEPSFR